MTKQHAKALLAMHFVAYRDAGQWLECVNEYVKDGVVCKEWITCPRTVDGLLAWLGH